MYYKYLMGFAKVACDAFALPDLYTYLLFRRQYRYYYFLIPFSLFTDVILSFPLGTFFVIDMIAYYTWRKLCKLLRHADYALLLYIIRYSLLYFVGIATTFIISQLLYCVFFSIVFRIIRGAKHNSIYVSHVTD